MNIKGFNVPTFAEWDKNKDYRTELGDYNLHIRAVSWGNSENGLDGSGYVCYKIGIACRQNPLNIYSNTIMHKSYKYFYSDTEKDIKLKNWYESVVGEANRIFKDFMSETYCEV